MSTLQSFTQRSTESRPGESIWIPVVVKLERLNVATMYYVRKRPQVVNYESLSLHIMSKSIVFAFLFLASLRLASAQFNFFDMFGQQQQQQQQQHQHKSGQAYSDSGASLRNSPCTS